MLKSITTILVLLLTLGCATTKKIKDGTTAYQQKQYAVAVEMLNQEIRGVDEGEEYAELAYQLGDSYRQLNDSANSLRWFIEAAKNDYGPGVYWDMAYALKKNERYADAILSFRRLGKYTDREEEIRKEIEKCRKAQAWAQRDKDHQYIVEALTLNSGASDYAPNFLGEDKIVFTSDRIEDGDDTYAWTGNGFSDLYVSDIREFNPELLSGINTEHNEGTAVFNQYGDIMYFTRCHNEVGDSYCKIFKSELRGGSWSEGELAFPIKAKVNYRDPVLIENDSVLIFVSDDPIGVGGSDLYYTFMLDDGTWDVPELMPTYLNSVGEERFPTWHNNTLYYSSDYFAGLGGLDIFESALKEDGSWSRPKNLLQPFNSGEDDYSYLVVSTDELEEDEKSRYFFTSTRGAFGNDDIYEAIEYKTEEEMNATPVVDTVVTEELTESKSYFLRVKVEEKIFAIADNPNSLVVGRKAVEGASVKVNEEILISDRNGVILMPFDDPSTYAIVAGKTGYLNKKSSLSLSQEELDAKIDRYVFDLEIELERIFEGVEITLENIYYDFDKDFIREDAKPSLDQLITILSDNPGIKIQLASHTDCQGEIDYNQELSQRRASSAVSYIQSQGSISAERLSAIGYGESNPELSCECDSCSDDEHQINRRTTFSIVK